MKIPAPMTMPTQIDAACHALKVLTGTASAVTAGWFNMARGTSSRAILPRPRAFGQRGCGRLVRLSVPDVLALRGGAQMSVAKVLSVPLALLAGVAYAAPQGAPPLVEAAEQGDRVAVNRLLDAGAAVDTRAVDGTTPLHWAARADRLETVRLLLESGADANAADRYGVTPLYLAAENGSAAVIAALLDAGADVNAVAPIGETALMTAVRTGVVAAVALLLDRGAAVDARDSEFEQTALMLAVRESHPEVVALLLARGAAVDARTRVGSEPKFVPPCKGTGCGSEGVGINRGGLPDRGRRAAALGGMTPLLYAARDGLADVARVLVEAGADLELGEANDIRPLLVSL